MHLLMFQFENINKIRKELKPFSQMWVYDLKPYAFQVNFWWLFSHSFKVCLKMQLDAKYTQVYYFTLENRSFKVAYNHHHQQAVIMWRVRDVIVKYSRGKYLNCYRVRCSKTLPGSLELVEQSTMPRCTNCKIVLLFQTKFPLPWGSK